MINKYIKITKIKSSIGIKKSHKCILRLLGLKKINSFVIKKFNNNLKYMINCIIYLIKCENIYDII